MPTILLIRHGESQANAGLPTSCPENIELTERGWEEARCVARELQKSYTSLDLIVTSRYRRALQTAEWTKWLFRSQKIPARIWPVHEFTYLSTWGKRNSTVEDRRPAVSRYWEQADPLCADGPDAESFEQFIERARAVKQCLEITKGTTAIFSHHQFICALLWLSCRETLQICAQTMRAFKRFLDRHPLANGTIVRVQFPGGGEPWCSEVLTSHLQESGKSEAASVTFVDKKPARPLCPLDAAELVPAG